VQERAVKMIYGLAGRDYEEKCNEIGLETLKERRDLLDMAQVYKLVHGIDKNQQSHPIRICTGRQDETGRRSAEYSSGPGPTRHQEKFLHAAYNQHLE
jgi:hypothetical protein